MCLILLDTRGEDKPDVIEREVFDRAAEINPDGMGIMWAWNGTLRVWRTLTDIDGLYGRYCNARSRNIPVGVHFRATTRGTTKKDNLHPFEVEEGKLAFMHNGTIKSVSRLNMEVGQSDTAYINEALFKNLKHGFLESNGVIDFIRTIIDGDRLLFMDGSGYWRIINPYSQGACWRYGNDKNGGVWLSKGKDLPYILNGTKSTYIGKSKSKGKNKGKDGDEKLTTEQREYKKWWEERTAAEREEEEKSDEYGRYLMGDSWEGEGVEYGIDPDDPDKDTPPVPKEADQNVLSLAQSGNLIFDYGYLDYIGFPKDEYGLRLTMIGTCPDSQLLAIGLQGRGSTIPALITDAETYKARGKVYSVPRGKVADVLDEMDKYYGCQYGNEDASVYYREKRNISLPDGGYVEAWVYDHRVPLNDFRFVAPVPHGDWSYWNDEDEGDHPTHHVVWVKHVTHGTSAHVCPACGSDDTYSYEIAGLDGDEIKREHKMECFECEIDADIIVDENLAQA